ncbi:MAG: winged helix-turn-helix domain-containing protein [bacterium]|nr:winged helix-turn-helix domain-containing protein [bacterium]
MKIEKLTKTEAQKIVLHSQSGFQADQLPGGAGGTLEVIRRLGHIQIDSISVIARSHHHIIADRHREYHPAHLDTLQTGPRRIFEYWSHAAAYLPIEAYRFCLPRMRRLKKGGFEWFARDKKVMRHVLDRIKSEGPLQARDFKDDKSRPGPWWGWKPAKIALEHLFMEGTLMVLKRDNFRKVYDLKERVLPADVDTRLPTANQSAAYLMDKAFGSLGIVSLKDIKYMRKDGVEAVEKILARRITHGDIVPVDIEGLSTDYYVKKEFLESLPIEPPAPVVRFLSPFDNLTIIRRRLQELYDFDYQLECYVPAPKRKFGYFSLLIFYDCRFVGLLDAKAHRKEKVLEVKKLHLEDGLRENARFMEVFNGHLEVFTRFNGCSEIRRQNS